MNTFLIIFTVLFVAVVAQQPSINCTFFDGFESYGCYLDINNPNGFNDFTGIGGIHLEGFSNDDVILLYMSNGVSSNVPSIICETFPNLVLVNLYYAGLTAIDDTAFRGCAQMTSLNVAYNQISTVSANAFSDLTNLQSVYLDGNALTTLPENVFANQGALTNLDLSFNPFSNVPAGLFRPLGNLESLYFAYANIDEINAQWFVENSRLGFLYLIGNRLSVSADSFIGLDGLHTLIMGYNGIDQVPAGTFSHMPNLQSLYLNGNEFVELPENTFTGLDNLMLLDLSDNPLRIIHDGAFRGLENLDELGLSNCNLGNLRATTFEHLTNVTFLSINNIGIDELPAGIFEPTPNLQYLGLWYNRLKVVRRNAFGSLTNLRSLGLDGNIVNALDRAVIDDADNLVSLFFFGNLCASDYFLNFHLSREQYLPMLDRCFSNMRYIIDTTTEGEQYAFFDGPQPGIALRVNTDSEIQIALTPFPFVWNPVVEVFIGRTNNMVSVTRFNQETDVAVVPTPNIIRRDQWNDFRVTWANQVIMVFQGNATFPFMSYTMESFVPVNFYGLRAVDSVATWSIQPLDF